MECTLSKIIFEFEWRFYAQSASKAIFRARTYSHVTYSVEIMFLVILK